MGTAPVSIPTFLTLELSDVATNDVKVQVTPNSTDATSIDFELGSLLLTIPAGSKKVSTSIKVNGTALKTWDKSVSLIFTSLDSGYRLSAYTSEFVIVDPRAASLAVAPMFPVNGANWNSYILSGYSAKKAWHISPYIKLRPDQWGVTDTPCPISATTTCLQGGELKKVVVTHKKNCTNLSMDDSEGAFEWRCADNVSPIYFYSVGFKKGKGLKNLISPTTFAWKTMSVTLNQSGSSIGSATPAPWWTNTINVLNAGNINSGGAAARLSLSSANEVYVVNGNLTSRGIKITADGIALVTLPGSSLLAAGTSDATDCRPAAWPSGIQDCFIWIDQRHRVWIEGKYNGHSSNQMVIADGMSMVTPHQSLRFHGIDVIGDSNMIVVSFGRGTIFSDINIVNMSNTNGGIYTGLSTWPQLIYDSVVTGGFGIYMGTTGFDSKVYKSKSIGSSQGVTFVGGLGTFQRSVVANSASIGISGSFSGTTIVDSVIANNTSIGINAFGPTAILNSSIFQNSGVGIYAQGSDSIISNTITANNGGVGISVGATSGPSKFLGIASIDNTTSEISFENNAFDATFSNYLKLGTLATKCSYGTGTTTLGVGTADCISANGNTFTRTVGHAGYSLFKGYTNDTANLHGSSGWSGLAFASITDYVNFESLSRIWTPLSTGAWPNGASRGKCASGSCGIFDFTFGTGGAAFKNINGIFSANLTCPEITRGSNSQSSSQIYTHLQGVAEYMLDGVGNEDGLCESDELCYFLPDVGISPNDPDTYVNTCVYEPNGGSITNVKIYGP